jgi:hypothetical protein
MLAPAVPRALHYTARRHDVIYSIVTSTITNSIAGVVGKKTIEMSRKIAEYARNKWPEHDMRLLRNMTGDTTQIHFVMRHKSLADHEEFNRVWGQDAGIKAIMTEWYAAAKELGLPLLSTWTVNYCADVE